MHIEELTTFGEAEFRKIQQLLPQLTGRTDGCHRAGFEALLAASQAHLLILREEGAIAGMLIVAIYPTLSGGRKAWIEDVVVDAECRGKGYGKALVSYAIQFARQQGADSVSLTSAPARAAANRLYRSLGFTQRETNLYQLKI